MARIFASLVSETESLPATRAYGAVMTNKVRLEMVAAAANAFFFQYPADPGITIVGKLDAILELVGGYAGRRNEIAHGIVHKNEQPFSLLGKPPRLGMRLDQPHPKRPVGWVLGPTDYTTRKTALEKTSSSRSAALQALFPVELVPSYAYSSLEISDFQRRFEALAEQASDFPLGLRVYGQRGA